MRIYKVNECNKVKINDEWMRILLCCFFLSIFNFHWEPCLVRGLLVYIRGGCVLRSVRREYTKFEVT